ncbi:MAG: chromosomal replication initiator protein DnaA [Minisyncoccota bacterium]
MTEEQQLWSQALGSIEASVSKANFSTWFKNTSVVKEEDGVVYVGVPSEFVRDWLSNKFHKMILRSLREVSDHTRGVEYIVTKGILVLKDRGRAPLPKPMERTLPLEEFYVNREDNLNPRYLFDSFVVGSFNELAFAAAQAIIETPGKNYNPFFVYGGTGLGKTHLIQAIGNHIKQRFPSKKIFYVTSEKFSMDYIETIQENKSSPGKINSFKEKYRSYDVLIMDDIQFLSNKEKTQEELFHMFNALHENGKQIIFSSDKHIAYIPAIEARLRSRFSAGMIVDVQQPEFESRFTILKSKASQLQFFPPQEVLEYLANHVQGNIRELEGALNAVVCQSQLKNHHLDINEVKQLVKATVRPKKNISVKEIVKMVSLFYNIEEDIMYEKTRRKEVVRPRQITMYILREDFSLSFPSIGQKLGGRDHTTVIHSYEKVKNDLKTDVGLMQEIEQLRAMLA